MFLDIAVVLRCQRVIKTKTRRPNEKMMDKRSVFRVVDEFMVAVNLFHGVTIGASFATVIKAVALLFFLFTWMGKKDRAIGHVFCHIPKLEAICGNCGFHVLAIGTSNLVNDKRLEIITSNQLVWQECDSNVIPKSLIAAG